MASQLHNTIKKTPSRFILLGIALFTLNSCLVGPDYKSPEMELPQVFRGAPSTQESIADLPWWKVIKSSQLQQLLRETYANNRDLKATIANVDSAMQYIGVASGAMFPMADYGVSTNRGNTASGGGEIKGATSSMLSASWELDIWGKTRRGIEAAEAEYQQADELMRGLQLSLLTQVSTSYLQLLMLDEQLRISKNAVTSYRKSLELFEARLEGGVGDKLQVESGRAALAAAEAQVPDIEAQIIALENSVCAIAGRTPGNIRRSGDHLTKYAKSSRVPAGIPAQILANRPDVRAAERAMCAANANVGVAIANFFPSINLTAAYGAAAPQLASFSSSKDAWNFSAGITGPLFRAGVLSSAEKIAENTLVAAAATYEQTVLSAMAEVATTLMQRQKLSQIMRKQEEAVAAYRLSLETSLSRYQNGLANYYEVLTAQQNLFPAEKLLAQYRYQYAATIPTLYAQLGGGWKLSHEEIRSGQELPAPKGKN